jgi:hypothetical protein
MHFIRCWDVYKKQFLSSKLSSHCHTGPAVSKFKAQFPLPYGPSVSIAVNIHLFKESRVCPSLQFVVTQSSNPFANVAKCRSIFGAFDILVSVLV